MRRYNHSNLTQRKRAGLISSHDTLKSLDRNQELLIFCSFHFALFFHLYVPRCPFLLAISSGDLSNELRTYCASIWHARSDNVGVHTSGCQSRCLFGPPQAESTY